MKYLPLLFAIITTGCASYELDYDPSPPGAPSDRLYENDLKGARDAFAAQNDPGGVAVTSLLLLPYSNGMTKLLTTHFGARAALDETGDVLWGQDGFVYFLSRGVPWEDTPSTAGIKTLLLDRLPWTRSQLDSVDGFVSGLTRPATLFFDTALLLVEELGTISQQLEEAAQAQRPALFLPGELFHDSSFSLTLGPGELMATRAVVEAATAAIYFVGAYENVWTMQRAFGSTVWADIANDPDHPEHVDGFDVADYQVAYLNASLGRVVASAARLTQAQTATEQSLRSIAAALRLGSAYGESTSLAWQRLRGSLAEDLAKLFDSLADSTVSATTLPHTSPATTANLSVLFEGRTIDRDRDLFVVEDGEVTLDEETVDQFADGAVEPPLDEIEISMETSPEDAYRDVTSELFDRLEAKTSGF